MTPYYTFLFLTLFLVTLSSVMKKQSKALSDLAWLFLLCSLAVIAAIRAPGVDRDYYNYLSWFGLINSSFTDAIAENKDLGFVYLYKIISFLTPEPWLFFFVISLLALQFKRKFAVTIFNGRFVGMLFLLIIARFYLLHEFTQIRAGLAIALSSYAVVINLNNKNKHSHIYFLMAILMHLSTILIPALLMAYKIFPFVRKRYFLLLLPLLGFCSAGVSILILRNIEMHRLLIYADADQLQGVSLLSFYYIVRFAVYYFILIRVYDYLEPSKKAIVYFSAVSLFSNAAFSWSSVISLRIVELLGMFDLAMFILPVLYVKNNSVWIYKLLVVILAVILFTSTVKIMNPYETFLFN
ncbi:EpsG family protein [Enterobacteriaceae bacterium H20N1]|uniref:EpsG family protein n=1 Tax=Dryocola boscaweniae TaxID=2925397 RepID=A0A9X3AQC1_9ENTR|nr:EpsG family protein [Dryocola boscaweniae]MCT4702590.1 EpsG family protein [Dryocola boscaweniae]MCT4719758.1 EpsG family protein [Dryocola boscaweniae]